MSLASQFLDTLNAIGADIKSLVSQTTKADKTEAEGLTDNTKLMTPLRVKEAVDAIIRTGKIVHTGNTLPVDPIDNMLWYDPDEGDLSVYYGNNGNPVWVTIISKSTPPSSGNSVALVDGGTASPRIPSVIINGGTA